MNDNKFTVKAEVTVYANTLADAVAVVQKRVQNARVSEDTHAVVVENISANRAKDAR